MPTATQFFGRPLERVSKRYEARFFGSLKTANATFKRTEAGRMAAVDAQVVRRLAASGSRITELLDLGISSGTTTIELINALRQAGQLPRVTGTDRLIHANLVSLPWGCRALVEPGGHVLQYDVFGAPIRPWRRRLDYVTGMAALGNATNRLLGPHVTHAPAGTPVALVSPHLARMKNVTLIEDDVTRLNPGLIGRFDLIRAANLLNRHYFSAEEMAKAVANVRTYLRGPGAWLLVVRTHNAADHHGTLSRVAANGELEVVERYGAGSEVEDLFTASERSA
ncbi:hypothetical protein LQ954_12720 [Sphingomonas sp. IC-11]|nr:hypothetical protein [Sphingomonas sp. IC-11]